MNIPWSWNYNPSNCPCKECKERTVGCHGTCNKYKEWQDKRPKKTNTYISHKGEI